MLLLSEINSGVKTDLFRSGYNVADVGWNGIRVKRTVAGEFTVYHRTTESGWDLVSAAYGTNPVVDTTHTTSSYFVYRAGSSGNKFLLSNTDGSIGFKKRLLA